ncbi:MAG: DUF1593 domain-containing protein [Acidobacteria bacterium]|nr:DUF1593 domain-containing protein [Acidobacteriota bacterium]
MKRSSLACLLAVWLVAEAADAADGGALDGFRHRVLVSTDIGGTDPDDFQSMVHLLLYADVVDLEGLVSSPFGPGRKQHILEVLDLYERDFPHLRNQSGGYPEPAALRRITKQGAVESHGAAGYGRPTEGSRWIIESARRKDARPLHVLVWGGIDDLAQALHDGPDILPKLRVYFIGGPNKMWSVDAYHYIEQHHRKLWMIEANSTYRGWFVGGNQTGEWGNAAFVSSHLGGRGALGSYFAALLGGRIKMGDSPSVGYLLRGTPGDPAQPGWGGRFVRMWDGRRTVFDRLTTEADKVEAFGTVEFAIPLPEGMRREHTTKVVFDGRIPAAVVNDGRRLRFRFSPRDAKVWTYVLESDCAGLNGKTGKFTAEPAREERTRRISTAHPNWWIDDPSPEAAEGIHPGAKSVNRWREEFLRDFAGRARRCAGPERR